MLLTGFNKYGFAVKPIYLFSSSYLTCLTDMAASVGYLRTMQTFVMGHIQGTHKALVQCLQRAGLGYEKDQLIQFGDIAGGYDQVYACVEELLKIRQHDEWLREQPRVN